MKGVDDDGNRHHKALDILGVFNGAGIKTEKSGVGYVGFAGRPL